MLLAVAMLAPAPAYAQGGPLSLPGTGQAATGAQRSGDPGMAEAERAAAGRRYDEAIERFDRVIAGNPRNVQARFERAWALAQAGREDEAVRAFSEIAQDFPELPEPHNNLALIYARRGDLKRAEAELLLAVEARPGFVIGYTNLGDVYRKMAESAYQEALKRNPADSRASSGLALLRARSGEDRATRGKPDAARDAGERTRPAAPPPLPKQPGPERPDLD
nr:tetratricopeptide repeat protein [Cupriavidus gilardii]